VTLPTDIESTLGAEVRDNNFPNLPPEAKGGPGGLPWDSIKVAVDQANDIRPSHNSGRRGYVTYAC
jgi:hypothetical protein